MRLTSKDLSFRKDTLALLLRIYWEGGGRKSQRLVKKLFE